MKTLSWLVIVWSLPLTSAAQTNQHFDRSGPIPWLMQDDMTARVEDFVTNNNNHIGKDKHIEGSFFLHDNWNKGYIKFDDSKMASNLLIRYNVYADKIYFLQDTVEWVLQNPAPEFGYEYTDENGAIKRHCFKNGYPAIDKNTAATFYETLVNGNFSLLKKHHKWLRQKLLNTGLLTYKIDDAPSWYAYSASKKRLVKITRDPHSLASLCEPDSLIRLEKEIKIKKIKLTTEKKMIELFEILNREGN